MIKIKSSTGVSGVATKTSATKNSRGRYSPHYRREVPPNHPMERWLGVVRSVSGNGDIIHLDTIDPTADFFSIFIADVGMINCELGEDHVLRCKWADDTAESYGTFTYPNQLFESLADYRRRLTESRDAAEADDDD